jgi:hypothetical protein
MQSGLELNSGTSELPRSGLVEAIWETLIALVTVGAISIGVTSLATHLNEARSVVDSAQAATRLPAVHPSLRSEVAGLGTQAITGLD